MLMIIMKAEQTNGVYILAKYKNKYQELFNWRPIAEICTNNKEEAKKAFLYMHPKAAEINSFDDLYKN